MMRTPNLNTDNHLRSGRWSWSGSTPIGSVVSPTREFWRWVEALALAATDDVADVAGLVEVHRSGDQVLIFAEVPHQHLPPGRRGDGEVIVVELGPGPSGGTVRLGWDATEALDNAVETAVGAGPDRPSMNDDGDHRFTGATRAPAGS